MVYLVLASLHNGILSVKGHPTICFLIFFLRLSFIRRGNDGRPILVIASVNHLDDHRYRHRHSDDHHHNHLHHQVDYHRHYILWTICNCLETGSLTGPSSLYQVSPSEWSRLFANCCSWLPSLYAIFYLKFSILIKSSNCYLFPPKFVRTVCPLLQSAGWAPKFELSPEMIKSLGSCRLWMNRTLQCKISSSDSTV